MSAKRKNRHSFAVALLVAVSVLLQSTSSATAARRLPDFHFVASVLAGEGGAIGEDFELMACTVRNRLGRGWSSARVMDHYHARPAEPTSEQVATVADILSAESVDGTCGVVYFFFSDWYVADGKVDPVVRAGGNSFFRYDDYKRIWQ